MARVRSAPVAVGLTLCRRSIIVAIGAVIALAGALAITGWYKLYRVVLVTSRSRGGASYHWDGLSTDVTEVARNSALDDDHEVDRARRPRSHRTLDREPRPAALPVSDRPPRASARDVREHRLTRTAAQTSAAVSRARQCLNVYSGLRILYHIIL